MAENYHEQVCTICGYVKIKYEYHEGDDYCTKCGCEIIDSEEPVLVEVLLKNKEWPDSHFVKKGETIQVIFTADKDITDAKVEICGYTGDFIKWDYSGDKKTCVAELFVNDNIIIAENTRITFSIDCKSITTGAWLLTPMTETTDVDSYLIYDSFPPEMIYIPKESY